MVTSHSPELLDDPKWKPDEIRVVEMRAGATAIGPLDGPTREALREKLMTAGELMRANQLTLDATSVPKGSQLNLFDTDS